MKTKIFIHVNFIHSQWKINIAHQEIIKVHTNQENQIMKITDIEIICPKIQEKFQFKEDSHHLLLRSLSIFKNIELCKIFMIGCFKYLYSIQTHRFSYEV